MRFKGNFFHVAISLAATLIASCASEQEIDYKNVKLPDKIFVADVQLGDGDPVSNDFLVAALDMPPGRCCAPGTYKADYRAYRDAPKGRPVTGQDIIAAVDPKASFYQISIPPPPEVTDIDALLGPLFGGRLRRHIMTAPQEGCMVVSGVRDGVLRTGVVMHKLPKQGKRSTLYYYNRTGIERCNISGILLMHGLPEAEAMDFEPYESDGGEFFTGGLVPDYAKLRARAAELSPGL